MAKPDSEKKKNLKPNVWNIMLIVLFVLIPMLLIGSVTVLKTTVKIMAPFFGESFMAAILGLCLVALIYFFTVLYAVLWGRYWFRFVDYHPHSPKQFKFLLGTVLKLTTITMGWFLAVFFLNMTFEAPS